MANERANNGNVPVDALLAALRRAAEEDGVDDVDAVVAEFATFVRAQAPQLASAAPSRRQGSGWTTAVLAAAALTTAAFGAVASGLVADPLFDTGASGSSSASGDVPDAASSPTSDLDEPVAVANDRPGAAGPTSALDPVASLDPELALVEAQQNDIERAAPTDPVGPANPIASTDPDAPVAPGGTAPSSSNPATTSAAPNPSNPSNPSPTTTTTTIPDEGGSDGTSGGDDVVEPLGATPPTSASSEEPLEMPLTTPSATTPSPDDQGGAG